MTQSAVHVRNLSKQYRIGSHQAAYSTLGDFLSQAVKSGAQRLRRGGGGRSREAMWALHDVSFDIARGEVVGIIGPNGAGKSTLLKILSRITGPTKGFADIYGRVGSLLEVGAGFHSELTGRENIFLNGAIIGMRRAEIARRFDEMVAFAEVDRFVDTPVKHYSSGMYLRLAFAVAAHLDAEVLMVDEVLAVGDAAYQRKCLRKMAEVAQDGRTVLFVSHNLAAVTRLCNSGIVLERGRIAMQGGARQAVHFYERSLQSEAAEAAETDSPVSVKNLRIHGSADNTLRSEQRTSLRFNLQIAKRFWNLSVQLTVRDADDQVILHERLSSRELPALTEPGTFAVNVEIPPLWLRPGLYTCYIKVLSDEIGNAYRFISAPLVLNVVNPLANDLSAPGLLYPANQWSIESTPDA